MSHRGEGAFYQEGHDRPSPQAASGQAGPKTVAKAVRRARQGKGPSIVENQTYRYSGHFQGEPQKYRTEEEVEEFRRSRDPIDRFKEDLLQEGILTGPQDQEIRDSISTLIEKAVQSAKDAPFPRPEDALEDLFVQP